jgi:hypothetical protein
VCVCVCVCVCVLHSEKASAHSLGSTKTEKQKIND